MSRALRAEFAKLKRSRLPLWTAVIVVLLPLVMFGSTRSIGGPLVSWSDFMRTGTEMLATLGVVIYGLVAAYLFGREYGERTATAVLTLPMRREFTVLAKGAVLLVWVLGLSLLSVGASAAYAAVLGLEGFSVPHLGRAVWETLQVSALLFGTLPVVALLAVAGRGYIAPMAFSGMAAWVGLGLAEAGWSRWFPWSMPAAVTGIVFGPPLQVTGLVPASWALMGAVFVAGGAALTWFVDTRDVAEG